MNNIYRYIYIISFTVALCGCGIHKQMKPLSPVFLEGTEIQSQVERVPFLHAWGSSNLNTEISSIYIKPVRTDLLAPDSWTDSTSVGITSKEDYNKAANELATYFDERLREELVIVYERNKRLEIVDTPTEHSVTLEIALTEIILSRPMSHALGIVAPVPGIGIAMSAMHDPHLAFAARFLAPDGKMLLGTIADRRFSPTRLLDLNKITTTSSAREIISQWAREIAEAIEFERLTKVKRSARFSWLPW